jgi:GR25 family glycosyltransferase involved in LPS biosynthesis
MKKIYKDYIFYLIIIGLVLLVIYVISLYKKRNENFELGEYYPGGMNRADQILFLNLDNRPDRLEAINKQLKCQMIQMNKVHRIPAHYTPGNGHLGCAKSHLDAIKYANEKGFENVIVLEDDFKFSTKKEQTHKLFDDLFRLVKNNEWDVIMLTHLYGKTINSKYPFIKKITDAQAGSGYMVNKSYYPIMISIFEKCVRNMSKDSSRTSGVNWEQWALDQVWKENQKEDRWFVFDPLIGQQDDELVSTIQTITNYNTK